MSAWPEDPNGDMVPILEASIAKKEAELEAAKARHPSAQEALEEVVTSPTAAVLTAADRCDAGCGAGALYRHERDGKHLDFCHHHHGKFGPGMNGQGWQVTGSNPSLYAELYQTDRLKGSDH